MYGPMGAPLGPCGATEHVVHFLREHSALDQEQQQRLDAACGFPCRPTTWDTQCVPGGNFSAQCWDELQAAQRAVGDFYVYNFYDTCGNTNHRRLAAATGGQIYPCGTEEAVTAFANSAEVRAALHLRPIAFYGFPWAVSAFDNDAAMEYAKFSGCSFSLYPSLLARYSAVIYNGDLDLCVPWSQNEEWTTMIAKERGYQRLFRGQWPEGGTPSGYLTTYAASPTTTFSFLTFKDAGHMVPMYQPERAYAFLERFLSERLVAQPPEFSLHLV